MSTWIWSALTGVVILAIVYALVRPGTNVSSAVTDVGNFLKNVVTSAVA